MEDNVYVFTAKIYKFGTDEVVEECQVLAYTLFMATHLLADYVYDEDSHFKMPVEIGNVERLRSVNNLINPDFVSTMDEFEENNEYDGSMPINVAKNMTDEEVMKFDCGQCKDEIKVPSNMLFPYVVCPSCSFKMDRKDIHNAGGIYYYAASNNDKK